MSPPPDIPRFRTIEISDPQFETENLREITVQSPALGQRADITVWAPPAPRAAKNVPLIILLHGVYGSHWSWVRMAGAHRIADAMIASGELPPCVLAFPSDGLWGDGSGYLPHRRQDFERWIVDDVPAAVRAAAPAVTEASPVCLGGLSMGGFGALRLVAKHPDRFVAASGHSSVTEVGAMRDFVADLPGTAAARRQDGSVLATLVRHRDRLPPFRFDCGSEDRLCAANRTLHRELDASGIAHIYEEFSGGHTWDYWCEHLPRSLRFFALWLRA